jgi:hypothetical protein
MKATAQILIVLLMNSCPSFFESSEYNRHSPDSCRVVRQFAPFPRFRHSRRTARMNAIDPLARETGKRRKVPFRSKPLRLESSLFLLPN